MSLGYLRKKGSVLKRVFGEDEYWDAEVVSTEEGYRIHFITCDKSDQDFWDWIDEVKETIPPGMEIIDDATDRPLEEQRPPQFRKGVQVQPRELPQAGPQQAPTVAPPTAAPVTTPQYEKPKLTW